MYKDRHLLQLPAVVGLIFAGALFWAQFRSYDFLDAATHFLTYQFPADNSDNHTHYNSMARPLWLLCGSNIILFRLLALSLIAGSTWCFWRAWRPLLGAEENSGLVGLTLGLSAIAGLAWLPILLGYNSLSTLFALLGLATLPNVVGLVPGIPPKSPGVRALYGLLFLVATALAFLAKPPAGLALGAWGAFLAFIFVNPPRWVRWSLLLTLAISAMTIGTLLIREVNSPTFNPETNRYFGGVVINPAWLVATFQRYVTELVPFLASLRQDSFFLLPPALTFAVFAWMRIFRRRASPRQLSFSFVCLGLALVAVTIRHDLWDGSFAHAVSGEMSRLYLLCWLAIGPLFVGVLWSEGAAGILARRNAIPVAAFFFLPLTSGFGSTNTLYFSALHWTVFWTAGLMLATRCIAIALNQPRLVLFSSIALALIATMHLFSGHFLRPYMNQPPLWRQNVPVAVGQPATVLKLDQAAARFLNDVRSILDAHGYQVGDDIFGFFNLPGLIFAMGARQPGAPWYFGTWYGGSDTDGGKIRQVPIVRRQHAWIISQADITPFRSQFIASGLDFPAGYEKVGQSINPTTGLEIGIWKPRPLRP